MLVLCLPTAFSETNRRSAIALLERPSAISARTSRSRAESLATGARTAAIPLANMAEIVQKVRAQQHERHDRDRQRDDSPPHGPDPGRPGLRVPGGGPWPFPGPPATRKDDAGQVECEHRP